MRDPNARIEYDSYDKLWCWYVEEWYESGQQWLISDSGYNCSTAIEAATQAAKAIQAHVDEAEKEKQK